MFSQLIDGSVQPAYIDAAKNLNGVGIDDRKFLVSCYVPRTYHVTSA